MFAPVLSILLGCSGPLFDNIQGIEVQVVSPDGLRRSNLSGPELQAAVSCLTSETADVEVEATEKRQLLQTTYLLLIRDNAGIRNFEMLTDYHLKGNKDRYYENKCINDMVQKHLGAN